MDQEPRALIKRHNEYVREQVVHDLEALEEKLNVKRQVSERAHDVVDKAKGTLGMNNQGEVHGVGDFVRHNAVPLAAVGVGSALLARNLRHLGDSSAVGGSASTVGTYSSAGTPVSNEPGMRDRFSDAANGVKDQLHDVSDTVTEKLGDARASAGEMGAEVRQSMSDATTVAGARASELKNSVAQRVPDRQQAVRMAKDNAPVLGIAALALGAVAGAFLPRTEMEKQRLAPLQESAVEKATDMVEEKVDTAKHAIKAGAETVSTELSAGSESETEGSTSPKVTTPNRITGTGADRNIDGMPASSL